MNKTPAYSLINGIATDCLDINERAVHYGDGVFETILYEDNRLYYWQQHFHRLQVSAQLLKIDCPDEAVFLDDIRQLVAANERTRAGVIKIIVSRGASERGYRFSKDIKASRVVMLSGLDAAHSSILSRALLTGELVICEQQASINETLAGMKHLNRLENVLARSEWDDSSGTIIDGLMLNAERHVIEGTMSNLFGVKDRQLFTPGLERSGIDGVMRDVVIRQAEKHYLQVSVTDLNIDDLLEMDELFITNSLIGMKRVTKLGNTVYNDQSVSELLFKKLLNSREDYAQAV